MAETSSIEWTNATWNVLTGCSIVSPGCTHCYAMKLAGTRLRNHPSRKGLTRPTKGGPVWTGEVRLNPGWLMQPLQWRRPRKIFVCAHADLFHESVPLTTIDRIFAIMALAGHHTFQVLTKRSARMRAYLSAPGWRDRIIALLDQMKPSSLWNGAVVTARHALETNGVLPNVWVGVSIEDKARLFRLDDLKATPAAHRYISAEPLLESLGQIDLTGINWMIVGGESGNRKQARPMHPEWARELRDQCAAQGVMFMFKQRGAWTWREPDDGQTWAPQRRLSISGHLIPRDLPHAANDEIEVRWVGKKKAGRLLDGRLHNDMPMAA